MELARRIRARYQVDARGATVRPTANPRPATPSPRLARCVRRIGTTLANVLRSQWEGFCNGSGTTNICQTASVQWLVSGIENSMSPNLPNSVRRSFLVGNSKRENREIPAAPWRRRRGRSANLTEGTAGTHAAGKSDDFIVCAGQRMSQEG